MWKAFQTDPIRIIISSEKISELSVISIFLHSLHSAWNAWRIKKTQLCVKKLIKTCFYEARKNIFFWKCTNPPSNARPRPSVCFFGVHPMRCNSKPAINFSTENSNPETFFKLIQGSIIFIKQNSESEKHKNVI